jgi:hypothetical protein
MNGFILAKRGTLPANLAEALLQANAGTLSMSKRNTIALAPADERVDRRTGGRSGARAPTNERWRHQLLPTFRHASRSPRDGREQVQHAVGILLNILGNVVTRSWQQRGVDGNRRAQISDSRSWARFPASSRPNLWFISCRSALSSLLLDSRKASMSAFGASAVRFEWPSTWLSPNCWRRVDVAPLETSSGAWRAP